MELLKYTTVLALIVVCVWTALSAFAQRRPNDWTRALAARRLGLSSLLALLLIALKVGEDVINQESGQFDHTVLLFVHAQLGGRADGFFQAVTNTAGIYAIASVAAVAVLLLLLRRNFFEALLIGGSTASAALCIWATKMLVGRERPALWETEWYWGSSFPSGHTLAAAALAIALALVVRRLWPAWQQAALMLAMIWIALIGLSRLVLGVHWPTDVIVAACVGAFLPASLSLLAELRGLRRDAIGRL